MELVKQIKALNTDHLALRSEREAIFLNNLKHKLGVYMSQNPVRMGKFENFYYNIKESDPFVNLKNIGLFSNTYTNSAALAIIILAIGIGGIASASQASLPGDNLYPIKILSEELRSALTMSPSAKALLEVEFSAKRIEEIKKVVQKSGIESRNIDVALDRLQKNTAKAADIIDKEKQNGNDVSELAKNFEEKNTANQKTLKQILKKPIEEMNESLDEKEKEKTENKERKGKDQEKEVKKNKEKKEITEPNSNLNTEKPEAKIETEKNEDAAIDNSEIKTKTRMKENNDEFDMENNEDID